MDSGVTTYAYPYRFFAKTDMVIYIQEIATGNLTQLTLNVDFTIAATAPYPTGTDIVIADPKTSAWKIIFQRMLPLTQLTEWPESGPFPALSHETALDRLTMIMQQINDKAQLLLETDITKTSGYGLPVPEAYHYIGWNDDEDAIINYDPIDCTAVQTSAANAAQYALDAQGYAAAAAISAAAALADEISAGGSETNADNSATDAENSNDDTTTAYNTIFNHPPLYLNVYWSIAGHYSFDSSEYDWDVLNYRYIGSGIDVDNNKMFLGGAGVIGSIDLYTEATAAGNPAWNLFSHKATGFSLVFKLYPIDFSDYNTILWINNPFHGDISGNNMWFYTDLSGNVRVRTRESDSTYYTANGGPISAGAESVVVFTLEDGATGLKVYINGELKDQQVCVIQPHVTGPAPEYTPVESRFSYTRDPATPSYGHFYGYIRPPRIYNRVLTPAEIAAITVGGTSYPASGLVGHIDYTDFSAVPDVLDVVSSDRCLCSWPVGLDETTVVYRNGTYFTYAYLP